MAGPSGAQFVKELESLLGEPYVYGATGPGSFDCSGLVQYTLTKLGLHGVPRTSEQQWNWVKKISKSQLQPGDLVFSQWPGDNASPGHVQIYVGNGQVIGADTVNVEKVPLSSNAGQIVGYGRAPGAYLHGGGAAASGGGGGGLLSLALPADILSLFSTAEQFFTKLLWLINPENWARILAGAVGAFLMLFGLGFLIAAAV